MNCAVGKCVYAFSLGLFFVAQSIASFAKDSKEGKSAEPGNVVSASPAAADVSSSEFQWNEHRKLSW